MPSERMKKELKNREEFLIQVFKRCTDINIILFLSQGSRCKLDLGLASELCQTVGDHFFLAYFLEFGTPIPIICIERETLPHKLILEGHSQ
jgi:hypothetical protein